MLFDEKIRNRKQYQLLRLALQQDFEWEPEEKVIRSFAAYGLDPMKEQEVQRRITGFMTASCLPSK